MRRFGILAFAAVLLTGQASAQIVTVKHDLKLLLTIVAATGLEQKELEAEYGALTALGTAHFFTQQEMEKVYELNKEFNDYLDKFHEVVAFAAQSYGIYEEVKTLVGQIQSFIEVVSDKGAEGYVAVAISPRRNDIYQDIIMETGQILEDIRKVVLAKPEKEDKGKGDDDKKTFKLTEKQRIDILFQIRPKLHALNGRLSRLELLARYTTMTDVWREIAELSYTVRDKKGIAEAALNRWRRVPEKVY